MHAILGGAWDYIKSYANTANISPIKACLDVVKRTCEAVALILEAAADLTANVGGKAVA